MVDIQRRLEELPHLVAALKTFLGGSMKVAYTSKVSRTAEPQAPMNVWVADLVDEIGDVIDRCGGLDIRTLVLRPAELFLLWVKGAQQKKYLDGVGRALDVRRIHVKAAEAVGLHEVWQRRFAPCPHCDQFTLGGWSGSSVIECTAEECGHKFTLDDYENYCLERING